MLQRFDDILAEIFQALDLHGLLLERLIQPRVFDGDGHIAGDGGEKLEVVAGKVVAVNRFAQAEHGDGAFAEAAGDEVVQIEFFERAPHGRRFSVAARRGFKEQAAALEGPGRGIEKREIERTFGADTHGARQQ